MGLNCEKPWSMKIQENQKMDNQNLSEKLTKKLPCNVSNLDFEIKFKLFVTIHPRFLLNLKSGDNQTVTLKSKENNFFVQAKLVQGLISESKYVTTKQGTYK